MTDEISQEELDYYLSITSDEYLERYREELKEENKIKGQKLLERIEYAKNNISEFSKEFTKRFLEKQPQYKPKIVIQLNVNDELLSTSEKIDVLFSNLKQLISACEPIPIYGVDRKGNRCITFLYGEKIFISPSSFLGKHTIYIVKQYLKLNNINYIED